ncbi:MAG: ATP-binding protein [Verrucomicrobiota bacterium]
MAQLSALAGACLFALVLVVWIKHDVWERLGRLAHSFATIESESFFLGMHVREAIVRLNNSLLRYQLSGDPAEKARCARASQEIAQRLSEGQKGLGPEEERITRQLQTAYQAYLEATAELRDRAVRGVRKDSASQVQDQIDLHSGRLLQLADQLVVAQNIGMKSFFVRSQEALHSLQLLLWLALAVMVGLIASVAALSYRTLVAPLRRQLDQTQSIIERQEKLASLGVLAAGVAHEVRNPLTAIKFRLFSFRKALPAALHDNEDLATIGSEVNRLEKIVRDFLQFARPAEPARAGVAVSELLRETQKLLRGELESRGIDLQVNEGPVGAIQADRQQIQQVLINLIQNGAESIAGRGTITLSVRAGATKWSGDARSVVIIEITDTGKGIAPEAQKRLFDPFFSTKATGTGLGLAIAARIVEKHGGQIQCATQPGRGTTFSVALPIDSQNENEGSIDRG